MNNNKNRNTIILVISLSLIVILGIFAICSFNKKENAYTYGIENFGFVDKGDIITCEKETSNYNLMFSFTDAAGIYTDKNNGYLITAHFDKDLVLIGVSYKDFYDFTIIDFENNTRYGNHYSSEFEEELAEKGIEIFFEYLQGIGLTPNEVKKMLRLSPDDLKKKSYNKIFVDHK